MITKTRTILEFDIVDGEDAYFESTLDGESEEHSFYELSMLKKTYEELGKPNKITVTIEPGDMLNGH